MVKMIHEYAEKVPESVRESMRDAVRRGLELARTRPMPGDGNMYVLFSDEIDQGKWGGGWDLQVSLLHDERRFKGGPHVIVDVESRTNMTGPREDHDDARGRMFAKVEYTREDRVAQIRQALAVLQMDRRMMDAKIEDLEKELDELSRQQLP